MAFLLSYQCLIGRNRKSAGHWTEEEQERIDSYSNALKQQKSNSREYRGGVPTVPQQWQWFLYMASNITYITYHSHAQRLQNYGPIYTIR